MDIINIIVTNRYEGSVVSVESTSTSEKDIDRDEKIARAEKSFVDKCLKNGISQEDAEESLSDGYMELNENEMVSFVWS